MSRSPRQKHSPDQWRQLIEAQAASGLSQVVFCAEHGLSKSSFQLWYRFQHDRWRLQTARLVLTCGIPAEKCRQRCSRTTVEQRVRDGRGVVCASWQPTYRGEGFAASRACNNRHRRDRGLNDPKLFSRRLRHCVSFYVFLIAEPDTHE
ncbi:IS66 family insertion sequence element accessory protein TnpA [Salinisphaera sp. SWV1]|uniref:IS66 family insertion sequence element accessory protein TnpA n=1 Tax=Salinisphaera sp. SWV1 TaxID=3454139 RepID=UPI003F834B16